MNSFLYSCQSSVKGPILDLCLLCTKINDGFIKCLSLTLKLLCFKHCIDLKLTTLWDVIAQHRVKGNCSLSQLTLPWLRNVFFCFCIGTARGSLGLCSLKSSFLSLRNSWPTLSSLNLTQITSATSGLSADGWMLSMKPLTPLQTF